VRRSRPQCLGHAEFPQPAGLSPAPITSVSAGLVAIRPRPLDGVRPPTLRARALRSATWRISLPSRRTNRFPQAVRGFSRVAMRAFWRAISCSTLGTPGCWDLLAPIRQVALVGIDCLNRPGQRHVHLADVVQDGGSDGSDRRTVGISTMAPSGCPSSANSMRAIVVLARFFLFPGLGGLRRRQSSRTSDQGRSLFHCASHSDPHLMQGRVPTAAKGIRVIERAHRFPPGIGRILGASSGPSHGMSTEVP